MSTNKVGVKKSLFNKPSWASSTSKPTNDDGAIFGQAHHYQEILQREKEQRERLAAKEKVRTEQESEKQKKTEKEPETKRRRISKEAEDKDERYSDDDSSNIDDSNINPSSPQSQKSDEPEEQALTRTSRSTPQKSRQAHVDISGTTRSPQTRSRRAQLKGQDNTIVLDDDDDENTPPLLGQQNANQIAYKKNQVKQRQKAKLPESDPESEEEDEYLRELKAKARAEARSKKLGIGIGTGPASPSRKYPADSLSPAANSPLSPQNARATSILASAPSPDDEAEVQIWIRTIIPGATDIIVSRKISQTLDKVREFWIIRNELAPAIADKVFFTWNNTRLYNSTTMRGIIDRLKTTHSKPDGTDPSNGKIVIEAVTEEILEYRQKQRANRLAEAAGDREVESQTSSNPDGTGESGRTQTAGNEEQEDDPQPQKTGIIIKLKAQGIEELPMRVRPHTSTRKILLAFCKLRDLDPGNYSSIWLSYDGDKLDDGLTVEEAGFEHEDTVEVYLRE